MCSGSAPNVPLENRPDADLQELAKVEDAYFQSAQSSGHPGPLGGNPYLLIQLHSSRKAQRILAEREQKRSELQRIANERTQLAAEQRAETQRLQEAQTLAAAEQQQRAQELQAQQVERVQQISAAGNAVASSLRVLGATPQSTAPTAAVAPTQKKKRGAPTAASSLRMGATASGRGAGTNLAI